MKIVGFETDRDSGKRTFSILWDNGNVEFNEGSCFECGATDNVITFFPDSKPNFILCEECSEDFFRQFQVMLEKPTDTEEEEANGCR